LIAVACFDTSTRWKKVPLLQGFDSNMLCFSSAVAESGSKEKIRIGINGESFNCLRQYILIPWAWEGP